MTAVDSSVVIPALLSWHEAHDAARRAMWGARAPMHALLEAYSVITRMPSPNRLDSQVVNTLLGRWFPDDRVLVPSARLARDAVRRCADADVSGGATYDGWIALIAQEHGEVLRSRDSRAAATYERLGVAYELLDR